MRRGFSLRRLAKIVHLSPSLVSQVETGKARPSVSSLFALSSALGLSLDRLFDLPTEPPWTDASATSQQSASRYVLRNDCRKVVDLENGGRWERLAGSNDRDVDCVMVEYPPGGSSGSTMRRHGGYEFGYIIEGTLNVTIDSENHVVGPGDSVAFPSTTPHRFWNAGDEPVRAIWIVVGRDRAMIDEPATG